MEEQEVNPWQVKLGELTQIIIAGRKTIASQSPSEVAELRYTLAMWRVYVGGQLAQFEHDVANEKALIMTSDEKMSVAKAEIIADALTVSTNRRTAKEMLETLTQLGNACASAINVLMGEVKDSKTY